MFGRGDRVVVGVSGGPDSVALLHWLSGYARENDLKIHVAHLDHMLRGEESAEDARWVQRFAASLGLTSTVEAEDVLALKRKLRVSIEDAARQARYSFFAHVAHMVGARCVAVAHTADDQVETVIHHWLRGAGLAGLRGMQPVMEYRVESHLDSLAGGLRVVRPLLDVWRREIEDYIATNRLTARVDRSNEQVAFLRNRIRLQLLPYLQSYNPRFKEAALRSARVLSSDYDFIQMNVSKVWDQVARLEERAVIFDLEKWGQLPDAIQRNLLREAMSRLVGDIIGLGAIHIDSALSVIRLGRTGARTTWPRGLVVSKSYKSFSIALPEKRHEPPLSAEGQRLEIPGRTVLFGTRWEVEASIQSQPCGNARNPLRAELDFNAVGKDLVVRRRKPGDRFRPFGMRGEKSLQDYFVDLKVPERERDNIPIVASPENIVWIVGFRIDDRAKVTPSTKQFLCLEFLESDSI